MVSPRPEEAALCCIELQGSRAAVLETGWPRVLPRALATLAVAVTSACVLFRHEQDFQALRMPLPAREAHGGGWHASLGGMNESPGAPQALRQGPRLAQVTAVLGPGQRH